MIDAGTLSSRLAARFRLDLFASPADSKSGPSIRAGGLDPPNGFRIAIASGWRSMEASFVPDPFASGLMKALCSEDPQRRKEFVSLAGSFAAAGVKCAARIDEKQMDLAALPEGPWAKFELAC